MSSRRKRPVQPPSPFVRNDGSARSVLLYSWWAGGQTGGGRVWNLSLAPLHLTLSGTAAPFTLTSGWGIGRYGKPTAMSFDGVDDMASLSTTDSSRVFYYGPTTEYSFSFWIKPRGTQPSAVAFLIGCRTGSDGGGWFSYYDKATSAVYWDYYGGVGDGTKLQQRLSDANTVPTGVWTHVTLTRDTTNTMAGTKIYINGRNNAGTTTDIGPAPTTPPYGTTAATFAIGKNSSPTANPFQGYIEDVRCYGRALSAGQVWSFFCQEQDDLKYQPGKRRLFPPGPDPASFLPHFLQMESDYSPAVRRNFPRVQNFWKEPLQGPLPPSFLHHFLGMDSDYGAATVRNFPRVQNFWKEPLQAAVDDEALTVPNPEQEQSKFVAYDPATRALYYKRWLNSTFWNEPVQGQIAPTALMLVDPIDATYSQTDMQDIQPRAAFWWADRRRLFSSTFGQTDSVTLALQEEISADKYTSPWRMRLLPRPPVTYTYGHSNLEPSLIPEDPPSLFMRSWFAPLSEPVRLPFASRPRHFYPVGTLDLDETQRPEIIYQAFEAPWRLPRWARAIRGHFYPMGELGIDNADRAEVIKIDEFRRIFDEPMRMRARLLAGQVAVGQLLIEPSLAGETVTIDKFLRPFDVPRARAGLFRGLMQMAAGEYDASTFSQPPIVKFLRSMLNAGF